MSIDLLNISKSYGTIPAVSSVSFTVKKGEFHGFIGPNGAGKSTTLHILMQFIMADTGHASIGGFDVKTKMQQAKAITGFLPSEVTYPSFCTVAELANAALIMRSNHHDERLRDNISTLAKFLELPLHQPFKTLSLGNRKKAGLLLSLFHEPEYLILDEPTSGFDPLIQEKCYHLLKEAHQRGATILLSSHVLSEVERICDHVVMIKAGKIIATESVAALTSRKMKHVMVCLAQNADMSASAFNHPALTALTVEGAQVHFNWVGEVKSLLEWLTTFPLKDIQIKEPTLESIFMHYYM